MKRGDKHKSHTVLPEMFRALMWSYRFEDINLDKHREEIIINTVNFGSLHHWRWLINHYGKKEIRRVLQRRLVTEFNPESRNLARLIFGISEYRHVPRSAH